MSYDKKILRVAKVQSVFFLILFCDVTPTLLERLRKSFGKEAFLFKEQNQKQLKKYKLSQTHELKRKAFFNRHILWRRIFDEIEIGCCKKVHFAIKLNSASIFCCEAKSCMVTVCMLRASVDHSHLSDCLVNSKERN